MSCYCFFFFNKLTGSFLHPKPHTALCASLHRPRRSRLRWRRIGQGAPTARTGLGMQYPSQLLRRTWMDKMGHLAHYGGARTTSHDLLLQDQRRCPSGARTWRRRPLYWRLSVAGGRIWLARPDWVGERILPLSTGHQILAACPTWGYLRGQELKPSRFSTSLIG